VTGCPALAPVKIIRGKKRCHCKREGKVIRLKIMRTYSLKNKK